MFIECKSSNYKHKMVIGSTPTARLRRIEATEVNKTRVLANAKLSAVHSSKNG